MTLLDQSGVEHTWTQEEYEKLRAPLQEIHNYCLIWQDALESYKETNKFKKVYGIIQAISRSVTLKWPIRFNLKEKIKLLDEFDYKKFNAPIKKQNMVKNSIEEVKTLLNNILC